MFSLPIFLRNKVINLTLIAEIPFGYLGSFLLILIINELICLQKQYNKDSVINKNPDNKHNLLD